MKKLAFIASIALVLFASCSKEAGVQTPGNVVKEEPNIVLSATADTKTSVNSDNKIVWASGDKLSVWVEGSAVDVNKEFSLVAASAGHTTADFEGALATSDAEFDIAAIYPYASERGSDPTAVAVSIPTMVSQVADFSTLISTSGILMGKAHVVAAESEHSVLFKDPLAYLKIVVDGTGSVLSDNHLSSVVLSSTVPFAGGATANLVDGTLALNEGAATSVTINYANVAMNTPQTAIIAINPTDFSTAGLSVVINTQEGQKLTFANLKPAAFEEQNVYTLTFNNLDKRVADKKATVVYLDLVARGGGERANCYIITTGGYYRFAAQNRNTNVDLGVKTADWIWSTGTASPISGVGKGNSGNINFRVEANTNANAVIAGRDADGNIVWSWHIWMTTVDPRTQPIHYTRNSAWVLMDRNLGALSNDVDDANSYGLYYQWGRKDPFPGAAVIGTSAGQTESALCGNLTAQFVTNGMNFSTVRNTATATLGDIAYSIRNPMSNIHAYQAIGTTNRTYTWFYTTPVSELPNMWMTPEGGNNTTGLKGKTIYDPCPAGWFVPMNVDYLAKNINNPAVTYYTLTGTVAGYMYSNPNDAAAGSSYYPAAGYRKSGCIQSLGNIGYYWTATPTDGGAGNTFVANTFQTTPTNVANGTGRTEFALSVRCMKNSAN